MIEALNKQIDELEATLLAQVRPTPMYRLLNTVVGIGPVLASVIALELGDIGRFRSAGDFVSYCRLVDSKRTSNNKKRGEGNRKNGNPHLAWAFMEAGVADSLSCWEARTSSKPVTTVIHPLSSGGYRGLSGARLSQESSTVRSASSRSSRTLILMGAWCAHRPCRCSAFEREIRSATAPVATTLGVHCADDFVRALARGWLMSAC
ncbi:MAG TPA: transposase [Vicinamibacterales bacterium]|nr:transposase [Vicinamibacterales bacterium]